MMLDARNVNKAIQASNYLFQDKKISKANSALPKYFRRWILNQGDLTLFSNIPQAHLMHSDLIMETKDDAEHDKAIKSH
jgi:hypothetical protein